MAEGSPMEADGNARFSMNVGGEGGGRHRATMIVGDLKGIKGIWGMDFFMRNRADMDLAKCVLHLHGRAVPLHKEASTSCCRIRVAETVEIPPGSEMFVKATITCDWESEAEGLVEPLTQLHKKPGLEVPRSLIGVTGRQVYVSITNFGKHTTVVTAGMVVAAIRGVSHLQVERKGEEAVGDLDLGSGESLSVVREMLGRIYPTVTQTTREALHEMVDEFREIFYEAAGELGRSGKSKHAIDLEGSKRVKIPPRRPPFFPERGDRAGGEEDVG